uniref:Uncharacterized protein n=1 Tax=Tarenaya spinosa TaxID=228870 RepID=Q1KUT8_9ROSI|nr:hypothetical protein [Tarenaya spinosa]
MERNCWFRGGNSDSDSRRHNRCSPKVDAFIAASERRSLGMCGKCSNLKMVACGRCKGTGSIESGGPFGFEFDLIRESSERKPVTWSNCQAKGCFPCPKRSKCLIH